MPQPKTLEDNRLPACYCNYYITNGAIIVPVFGDPADEIAMQQLQDCYPDRAVVGVKAIDLVWGLGAFHCMTQQQPKAGSLTMRFVGSIVALASADVASPKCFKLPTEVS